MRITAAAIALGLVVVGGCHAQAAPPPIPASPRAHDETFASAALGRPMKYRVLLPAGYEQGRLRYPVLYLLHGAYGGFTDWTERSHVAEYTDELPLIVVMPEGGNSWYINSAADPRDRFEDYIANDVVREIDRKYRTVAAREGRAIAGNSMGGYGAVNLALKYPSQFAFVGSFGGALQAAERPPDDVNESLGPPGSSTRKANDVLALAAKSRPERLPFFWFAWGDQDDNGEENRSLMHVFDQQKIAYTFLESPGKHNWKTWDAELPAMLKELARHMKLAAETTKARLGANERERAKFAADLRR